VFVCGASSNRNLLCCQSHPEFELQYAVTERIWPAVVEQRRRLSEQEADAARSSFADYSRGDADTLCAAINRFLRAHAH
jgi:hypothetical protein